MLRMTSSEIEVLIAQKEEVDEKLEHTEALLQRVQRNIDSLTSTSEVLGKIIEMTECSIRD